MPVEAPKAIKPGVSELFIFKITGIKSGSANAAIRIIANGKEEVLKITNRVLGTSVSANATGLSATNWAYLNYPMLKDRQEEAAKDLELHHINTVVVPAAFIPRPGSKNFTKLLNYLAYFKNLKNILLFTSYTNPSNRHGNKSIQFMSPEWKRDFTDWYTQMLQSVQQAHNSAAVYFYPYDEVRGKHIDEYRNFLTWAKKEVPALKVYATLSTKAAIDKIISFVDVAQIPNNLNF